MTKANEKPIKPEEWEPAEINSAKIEDIGPSLTYRQDVWMRFKANKAAMAGAVTILLLILSAVFGPYFSKHSYDDQVLPFANIPPILKIYKIGNNHFLY
ncbi:MAG: ABC transporter permease, partial [Spirochaetes bacterium]